MANKAKPAKLSAAELPTNLDPLHALVLASLPGATDEQRDALSGGDHEVDLDIRIRVQGKLTIGADCVTTQVNLIPWMEFAALLANQLPQAKVDEALDRAIAVAKQGRDSVAAEALKGEADNLKARIEAAFEQAKLMVSKTRRGSVRLLGTVDVDVKE